MFIRGFQIILFDNRTLSDAHDILGDGGMGMQPEGIQRSYVRDLTGQWSDLHLYGLLEEEWLLDNKE